MDVLDFWMAVRRGTCLADLLVDFEVALMVVELESEKVVKLVELMVFSSAVERVAWRVEKMVASKGFSTAERLELVLDTW